jgi:hypothetical protein
VTNAPPYYSADLIEAVSLMILAPQNKRIEKRLKDIGFERKCFLTEEYRIK